MSLYFNDCVDLGHEVSDYVDSSCSNATLKKLNGGLLNVKKYLSGFNLDSGENREQFPGESIMRGISDAIRDKFGKALQLKAYLDPSVDTFSDAITCIEGGCAELFTGAFEDEDLDINEFLDHFKLYHDISYVMSELHLLKTMKRFSQTARDRIISVLAVTETVQGVVQKEVEKRAVETRLKRHYKKMHQEVYIPSCEEKAISAELLGLRRSIHQVQHEEVKNEEEFIAELKELFSEIYKLGNPSLMAQYLLTLSKLTCLHGLEERRDCAMGIVMKNLGKLNFVQLLNVLSSLPFLYRKAQAVTLDKGWDPNRGIQKRQGDFPEWNPDWNELRDRILFIVKHERDIFGSEGGEHLAYHELLRSIYFWGWKNHEDSKKFIEEYEEAILKRERRAILEGDERKRGRGKIENLQKESFNQMFKTRYKGWRIIEKESFVHGLPIDFKIEDERGNVFYIEYDEKDHYDKTGNPTAKTLRKVLCTDRCFPNYMIFRVRWNCIADDMKYIEQFFAA